MNAVPLSVPLKAVTETQALFGDAFQANTVMISREQWQTMGRPDYLILYPMVA